MYPLRNILKGNRLACCYFDKITRCYTKKLSDKPNDVSESPLKRLLNDAATYSDKNVVDPELQWATSPYPTLPNEEETRPRVDPRETSVILFPGQGSQYVGMGKELRKYPAAKDLYELANSILGFDLLKICLEGPEPELIKHCQLAVMVTSLASLERLKEERPSAIEQCTATAGFSLGEITSLVFSGALEFEQALRLVQIRATAMEAASKDHPGGMVTVLYGPDSKVNRAVAEAKKHCEQQNIEGADCQIANYLYPHCKVIAGSEAALKFLMQNGKEFGLRRVQKIKVSGAFHTNIMRPAVEPFRAALKLCNIEDPSIKVISNVDARPYRNANHIFTQLPKQMVRSVKWEQSMHKLFARQTDEAYPQTFTMGPGTSLRSILKQVNARAWDSCMAIAS